MTGAFFTFFFKRVDRGKIIGAKDRGELGQVWPGPLPAWHGHTTHHHHLRYLASTTAVTLVWQNVHCPLPSVRLVSNNHCYKCWISSNIFIPPLFAHHRCHHNEWADHRDNGLFRGDLHKELTVVAVALFKDRKDRNNHCSTKMHSAQIKTSQITSTESPCWISLGLRLCWRVGPGKGGVRSRVPSNFSVPHIFNPTHHPTL